MRRPPIYDRIKRYVPRQCVADHGMHKDAPLRESRESGVILTFRPPTGRVIYSARPQEATNGRR